MKKDKILLTMTSLLLVSSLIGCSGNNNGSPSIDSTSEGSNEYNQLTSSLTANGSLSLKIYETQTSTTPIQSQNSTIETKINEEKYLTTESINNEMTYKLHCSYSDDGYVVKNYVDENNQVVNAKSDLLKTDSYYRNPFASITFDKFSTTDNISYTFNGTADEKALFEGAFGGYEAVLNTVSIEKHNNVFDKLIMSTGIYLDDDYGYYFSYDYSFSLSNLGATTIDDLTPYAHVSEHDNLATALAELKDNNYTLVSTAIDDDTSESEITTYKINPTVMVTEQDTVLGSDTASTHIVTGVKDEGDSSFNFNYIAGSGAFKTSTNEDKVSSSCPTFAFAPEIFNYVGNSKFALNYGLAETVMALIGIDFYAYFASENSIYLTLENGHVSSISFSYNVMGFLYGEETYEYSNIGSTVITYDLSDVKTPSTWKEQSLFLDASLRGFVGESYASVIPFINCGVEWEDNSYDDSQLNFTTAGYAGTVSELFTSYETLLLDNGYVKGTATDGYTTYTNSTAKIQIDLGIYDGDLDMYISKIA